MLFTQEPMLAVRETFTGVNGSLTDQCVEGNLQQAECVIDYVMGPPLDPAIWPFSTGAVRSTNIDCDGRCVDGACPDVCPEPETMLEYVSVDEAGNAVLLQPDGQLSYSCELLGSSGELDCAAIDPGTRLKVVGESLEAECVGLVAFTTGTDGQNVCWYANCAVARN
jgi:hypothetical protein